ncbi:MAG: hypothetical protein U1D30_18415 [Planctomycetota bacterium]
MPRTEGGAGGSRPPRSIFSNLEFAVGLGPLNDKKSVQGLLVHSLALSLDGTPLGLLDQQSWARPKGKKTRDKRRKRALKDKESSKWLAGAVAARGGGWVRSKRQVGRDSFT